MLSGNYGVDGDSEGKKYYKYLGVIKRNYMHKKKIHFKAVYDITFGVLNHKQSGNITIILLSQNPAHIRAE